MEKPTPGSKGAIEMGCTCPVLDNYRGKGINGQFWVDAECPVHGKTKKGEKDNENGKI